MKFFFLLFASFLSSPVFASAAPDSIAASGPSSTDVSLLITFVLLALVFSFLCSVAEAVLLSITPSYIEKLKASQPKRAVKLKTLRQDNVDRSLAAILTVNTIAHTVGAIAAGAKATVVFGSAWIGVFSGAMTLGILFLSEIIPKTIGAIYWPSLVGVTMTFITVSIKALYPLIWISEGLTKLIARGKKVHLFSRDELLAMTNIGERSGQIETHEAKIIHNLIRFNSLKATDIMTPRTVVVALNIHMTVSEALEAIFEHTFSRLPVYDKDMDDITGVVLRDEVLALEAQNNGHSTLGTLRRDIRRIDADMPLPNLLELFIESRQHMALIVDVYGGTKGIITLEDVIEALLGMEIMDEMDSVEDMRLLARTQWLRRAKKLGVEEELLHEQPDVENEDKQGG